MEGEIEIVSFTASLSKWLILPKLSWLEARILEVCHMGTGIQALLSSSTSRHIRRELGQKWNTWDLNWHPHGTTVVALPTTPQHTSAPSTGVSQSVILRSCAGESPIGVVLMMQMVKPAPDLLS